MQAVPTTEPIPYNGPLELKPLWQQFAATHLKKSNVEEGAKESKKEDEGAIQERQRKLDHEKARRTEELSTLDELVFGTKTIEEFLGKSVKGDSAYGRKMIAVQAAVETMRDMSAEESFRPLHVEVQKQLVARWIAIRDAAGIDPHGLKGTHEKRRAEMKKRSEFSQKRDASFLSGTIYHLLPIMPTCYDVLKESASRFTPKQIEQEAGALFMNALYAYELGRATAFQGYLRNGWLENQLWRKLAAVLKDDSKHGVSLSSPVGSKKGGDDGKELGDTLVDERTQDPQDVVSIDDMWAVAGRVALEKLRPREAQVLRLRFNLTEDFKPDTSDTARGRMTLDEISKEWGITRERVRQIEARALTRLMLHTQHLRQEPKEKPRASLQVGIDPSGYPKMVPPKPRKPPALPSEYSFTAQDPEFLRMLVQQMYEDPRAIDDALQDYRPGSAEHTAAYLLRALADVPFSPDLAPDMERINLNGMLVSPESMIPHVQLNAAPDSRLGRMAGMLMQLQKSAAPGVVQEEIVPPRTSTDAEPAPTDMAVVPEAAVVTVTENVVPIPKVNEPEPRQSETAAVTVINETLPEQVQEDVAPTKEHVPVKSRATKSCINKDAVAQAGSPEDAVKRAREAFANMEKFDQAEAEAIARQLILDLFSKPGDGMLFNGRSTNKFAEMAGGGVGSKGFNNWRSGATELNFDTLIKGCDALAKSVLTDSALAEEAANYMVGIPWGGKKTPKEVSAFSKEHSADITSFITLMRRQERKQHVEFANWIATACPVSPTPERDGDKPQVSLEPIVFSSRDLTRLCVPKGSASNADGRATLHFTRVASHLGLTDPEDRRVYYRMLFSEVPEFNYPPTTREDIAKFFTEVAPTMERHAFFQALQEKLQHYTGLRNRGDLTEELGEYQVLQALQKGDVIDVKQRVQAFALRFGSVIRDHGAVRLEDEQARWVSEYLFPGEQYAGLRHRVENFLTLPEIKEAQTPVQLAARRLSERENEGMQGGGRV